MTNNCSKYDHSKHPKRIMEREIWGIVETGEVNFKNNGVTDGVMDCYSLKYSSHTIAIRMDHENVSEWVLVKIPRSGKKRWTTN